ncbi:hydrogenase assembly protein HupF [Sulfurimicrobium lacus]|uniref:Hydrogenase assembly protein HupF n=1 Tax=Sulfurimicrobium lacus TaxID=2715678 RepID=A0A6F8VFQ1_9PROT|nr:nickel-dependent hydrogenase large subunit [Sulfurimicrobium lacus]BCB28548.1 hydrogenase assembly protein HupF [Sulfurimicrobium lacus]
MDPGGKIHIRLSWDGARINSVELAPRHSVEAIELLRRKTGQQAVNLIPLLFSLCGKAQGVAGAMALEAARGVAAPAETAKWRERLVRSEAIQEALWRFLLDVPKIVAQPPMVAEFTELRRGFARVLDPVLSRDGWKTAGGQIDAPDAGIWMGLAGQVQEFLSTKLLGMPLPEWRRMLSVQDMEHWLDGRTTPLAATLCKLWAGKGRWGGGGVPLLPPLRRGEMLNHVLPELERERNFAMLPCWQGAPAETGALARMAGHPLISTLLEREGSTIFVRLLARLLEVVELGESMDADEQHPPWLESASLGTSEGAAWVQTARGLLVHRLALDTDGKVADYRIVAPTEWNFHSQGAYTCGLTGRPATTPDEAREAAELLLLALDPCVAYEVELNHA